MALHSLRNRVRPDSLQNQPRASQSLARKIYLGTLAAAVCWIASQVFGPLLLLDADGLMLRDREVLAPVFSAQVVSVNVRPGDAVKAGTKVGSLISTQMIDLISDLSARYAQTRARRDQIEARLAAIQATLPTAEQRVEQTLAAFQAIERAKAGGFATVTRYAQASQTRYEAAREAVSLRADAISLRSEATAIDGNIERLRVALETATKAYGDGALVAPLTGTVGSRVVSPGTVLKPGEAFAEVYHGASYVIAYIPTSRLYSVSVGQCVVISDGVHRQNGTIERVEGITDAVPPEFQSSFRSVDRQQLIRVKLEGDIGIPLYSKIKVTSMYWPRNLIPAMLGTNSWL